MPPQIQKSFPRRHTRLLLLTIIMILLGILAAGYFLLIQTTPIGPNDPIIKKRGSVATTSDSGIQGTVFLGPTCPVERTPPDPGCADKPFKTDLILTSADQSQVLKQFSSNEKGEFIITVNPGQYSIRSAAAANILPYCSSDNIKVNAGAYTKTSVNCDSGIR